jgi:hypothetical protein
VEAARILGMLGLPKDTTMQSRSFPTIEERSAPTIKQLHDEIMLENLTEEVRQSVDTNCFHLWKSSLDPQQGITLLTKNYPTVQGSYDTGWNQRGQLMNSPSGHSFLVGKHTRKPIGYELKSKWCSFCSSHKRQHRRKQPPIPPIIQYKVS